MSPTARVLPLLIAQALAGLLSGAELSGRVVDATGAPLPTTVVDLRREGDIQIIRRFSTDSSGVFQFRDLPADTYQLSSICKGFKTNKVVRSVTASEIVALGDIVLQVGAIDACPESWQRPVIELKPISGGAQVVGRVEQWGGSPTRGAVVTVSSGRRVYRSSTGPDGAFEIPRIKSGRYDLRVVLPGFADFVINGVRVRDHYRTEILDTVQLPPCPTTVKCRTVQQVLKPNICL